MFGQETTLIMDVKPIAAAIFKREHIAVIGTTEELEAAASTYDWRFIFSHEFEHDALLLAGINLNTREIVVLTDTRPEMEGIRETIINYSRYGRYYDLNRSNDRLKLEDLFSSEYTWTAPGVNPRVLAENINRWCNMLEEGFKFSRASLEVMKQFCELNELYTQCALINENLTPSE
jgi:hypothetical protein